MELGSGYDDMIGCAEVVSVSTLYSRCSSLALFLISPHVYDLLGFMEYILLSRSLTVDFILFFPFHFYFTFLFFFF